MAIFLSFSDSRCDSSSVRSLRSLATDMRAVCWPCCLLEACCHSKANALFRHGKEPSAYEVHLANKCKAAGKERHPAGLLCCYKQPWHERTHLWSLFLGPAFLVLGGVIFAVRRQVVVELAIVAAPFLICGWAAIIVRLSRRIADAGDIGLADEARQIDVDIAACLEDGTIRLLDCAWLRRLGQSAPRMARCTPRA